ncbi:hypothetical protein SCORR_v1c03470 [Spiroplasma corruscae]|uniref:Uncharacterized protein n=1 Tax=Spiroplasma corruscae TaxID=216934 RepID=A0A222EP00_9MOLU|nr:hypothetical protein [Spiroplasma corruscae]ASP28121.1 hypothetical protein SCORR_v1c03470 [Spiroplasma corruscae]
MSENKKLEDVIDDSAEQAFQDLLDLVFTDLEKNDVKKEKKLPFKYTNNDSNNLSSIINRAKNEINSIKTKCEKNYIIDPEEEIIKKAKIKGKSQYDSDVLREIILNRQKNKRSVSNDLTDIIKKAKFKG